jgi:hypothetical protein
MKKSITIILFAIAVAACHGQTNYINVCVDCDNLIHSFDFNSPSDSTAFYFIVDTAQENNLWQVGKPNKTIFNQGYGGPKALVTDTLNPYPINNTSSFQFSLINCSQMTQGGCGGYNGFSVIIDAKINTDSTKDGGTIEVSHNNSPFINVICDSLASISGDIYSISDTLQSLGQPGFSGSSSNWNHIVAYFFPRDFQELDTITLRFTFSSDSNQTNKDGWMIGQVQIHGLFEGINEIQNDNLVSIFPNPTSDELFVQQQVPSNRQLIQIFDFTGRLVFEDINFTSQTVDTRQLSNGIYLLKYSDTKNYALKKFVVQH